MKVELVKKPKAGDILSRFMDLSDEVPISDEEAKEVLSEVGIDPQESLSKLLNEIDRRLKQEEGDD